MRHKIHAKAAGPPWKATVIDTPGAYVLLGLSNNTHVRVESRCLWGCEDLLLPLRDWIDKHLCHARAG